MVFRSNYLPLCLLALAAGLAAHAAPMPAATPRASVYIPPIPPSNPAFGTVGTVTRVYPSCSIGGQSTKVYHHSEGGHGVEKAAQNFAFPSDGPGVVAATTASDLQLGDNELYAAVSGITAGQTSSALTNAATTTLYSNGMMSKLFPQGSPTAYTVPIPTTAATASATAGPTPAPHSGDTGLQLEALGLGPTTTWSIDPHFTDIASAMNVTAFADGSSNMAVVPLATAAPASWTAYTPATSDAEALAADDPETSAQSNLLRVLYPAGSINPAQNPVGGGEFYATPLDIAQATNVTLEYSTYFPANFSFVQGGKLPGLYGGHEGCSGGDAAADCFSTRMMFRTDGAGEMYLYAPRDKQGPALCKTPPKSVCSTEYGLSIGRGAFFYTPGEWTSIRQDVWLNTPGVADGGFNVWANGVLVITANDVYYRDDLTASSTSAIAADTADSIETLATSGSSNASSTPYSSIVSLLGSGSPLSELLAYRNQTAMVSAIQGSSGLQQAVANYFNPEGADSPATAEDSVKVSEDEIQAMVEAIAAISTPAEQTPSVAPSTGSTPTTATISGMDWSGSPMDAFVFSTGPGYFPAQSTMSNGEEIDTETRTVTVTVPHSDETAIQAPTPMAQDMFFAGSSASNVGAMAGPREDISDYTVLDPSEIPSLDAPPPATKRSDDGHVEGNGNVAFIGIFFSTFFGGHTADWASPTDQHSYFRDFAMRVNAP